MLRRILIGLSGTEHSRAAAELAVGWAEQYHASIAGIAIVDIPHLTAPEAVPLGAGAYKIERDEVLVRVAGERASQAMDELEVRCAAAGVSCHTIKREGDPEKLLVLEAQRADLLFLGKTSISEELAIPDSRVLRQILRHTSRPVVCVAQCNHSAAVLVAYDGSAQAAKSLQMFQCLGLGDHREIHVLTVSANPADRYPGQCAGRIYAVSQPSSATALRIVADLAGGRDSG